MNKKLFLGMLAAAGMLCATSCSNDELEAVKSGDLAQVTFSLGVDGNIAGRAVSDGESANKLVCAIYDVNGNLLRQSVINNAVVNNDGQFVNEKAFEKGLTEEITATLAKGQTYTMAFWAQNKDCDAYITSDLTGVEINYDGLNNDESRDAFFAAETFKVNGDAEIDVTLKRPFAQINVGVSKEDWDAAIGSGVNIITSKAIIKNAADKINVLDGSVDGEVEVEYDFGTIPQHFDTPETLNVDTDGDGTKEAYKYLSMSYILVNDENGGASKATLESEGLQFTFRPESGNDILFFEGLNNVPVQRNWRTNILGKFLTGDVQFNITIDPIFDGEYNSPDNFEGNKVSLNGTYYKTIEEALAAAKEGDVIHVGEGTYASFPKIAQKITMVCEEGTVFDKTTASLNVAGSTIIGATFRNEGGNATYGTVNGIFKDCHFEGKNAIYQGYAGDVVEFDNCTFVGDDYTFHFDNGKTNSKVVMRNCVIDSDWRIAVGAGVSLFEATGCKFYARGFMNMWGKANLTDCEFNKPQYWVCSMDEAVYTNCKFDGRALTANDITIDGTIINVNGKYYTEATTAEELTNNLALAEAAYSPLTVLVKDDIAGNATAVQKENVDVVIEGNNHKFNGALLVDGKSARYATAGVTVQNLNFTGGDEVTTDAYVRLGDGNTATRYTSNVTVKDCTFSTSATKDMVAIKSYTGGDHNLSIVGCTANAGMHSLAQLKNVEKGLKFKDCKAYSSEGVNLNETPSFEMEGCVFDVQGYAIRVGVNGAVNTGLKTFDVSNSTLKSACVESDDAVIVFRTSATYAKLTLTDTTLEGAVEISGNTDATVIEKK